MTRAESSHQTGDDAFPSGVPGRLIVPTDGKDTLQASMGR